MKRAKSINNLKLGVFVLAGVVFLVFSLYMIGKNRNMFGPTFTLSTYFRNINGLVAGNNVRFSGIDVGTVRSISVQNDTSVLVVMVIDRKMKMHIKKNSIASIGTDGLVGNKLVNISSIAGSSPAVENGGVIISRQPLETDEMLRTLQTTNDNIAVITQNLREVSVRLNGSATLWNILADTVIVQDLKSGAAHFNRAGANTESATEYARDLADKLSSGNGLANSIFTDTSLRVSLEQVVSDLRRTGRSLDTAALQLKRAAGDIRQGKGTVGVLLADTVVSSRFVRSMQNIEQGTDNFNKNMEALKSNFLFRKYYRKQKRAAGK